MSGLRVLVALLGLAAVGPADAEPPLAAGELVIADCGGRSVAGHLYRFSLDGGPPRPIETSIPLAMPTGVAIDGDGTIVVAEIRLGRPGRVLRVDPTSGVVTPLADGWPLLAPVSVAIDDGGDVLVADLDAGHRLDFPTGSLAGTGAIYRIPRTAGLPALLSQDCCPWNASAVAPMAMGELAVLDLGFSVFTGNGAVTLVDPVTGIQRALATSIPLLDPSGIVVGPLGSLFVTDATNPQVGPGAVLAIEPRTGTVTVVATGAPITDPRGIAVTNEGDLVVADPGARVVYRIAMPGRALDVIASGDPLVTPCSVAVMR